MALDEPKGDDKIFENNGIKFFLDNQTTEILSQSGGLTIDYVNEDYRKGYQLTLGSTGGDCSSGGCSGCG